jgi:hypothetical protein
MKMLSLAVEMPPKVKPLPAHGHVGGKNLPGREATATRLTLDQDDQQRPVYDRSTHGNTTFDQCQAPIL